MTFTVLVVCRANVCRSPALAALLADRFAAAGLDEVEVVSAGVAPDRPEAGVCPDLGALLPDLAARLTGHRPRPVTPEAIAGADLVLTADRPTRAAALRDGPGAHDRVLTLRHAAALGSAVGTVLDAPLGAGGPVDVEERLRRHVQDLGRARGRLGAPGEEAYAVPRRPWQRIRVHAHDVPDAHPRTALHAITARLLVSAADDVAARLVEAAETARS